MADTQDIIIIGGGVIGLACAHYLISEGARVTLIEKDQVGMGASHGNCGLLYFSDLIPLCAPGAVSHEMIRGLLGTSPLYIKPEPDLERFLWLARFAMNCRQGHMDQAARDKYEILIYSARLFSDLLKKGDLQCGHEKNGILSVFKEKKNIDGFKKKNDFLKKFNIGYRRLTREDTLDLEPALSDKIAGAWYSETDQHLRPEHLMAVWKDNLVKQGLIIEERCEVLDIQYEKGSVKRVLTSKGDFSSDFFVLATGAWSPVLARRLNLTIPVQAGKGYSITMGRPSLCPKIPCMLCEKNMVVTPWESGYRLGGTMEFSGFSHSLNPLRLKKLVDGAGEYMRTPMGQPLVEEWTGLRPMTHDDMPIIGRSSSNDNLYIATGHGMLGLTLATGTGKLISDMIFNRAPGINTRPYSPDRF